MLVIYGYCFPNKFRYSINQKLQRESPTIAVLLAVLPARTPVVGRIFHTATPLRPSCFWTVSSFADFLQPMHSALLCTTTF